MKPKLPQISESRVQAAIVQLLRSLGGAVYILGTRRPRGDVHHGTCQTPGIPDVFCLLPPPRTTIGGGQATGLWVEVKAKGGRLRPAQAAFREQCVAAGVAHVVGGMDDVIAFLAQRGYVVRTDSEAR